MSKSCSLPSFYIWDEHERVVFVVPLMNNYLNDASNHRVIIKKGRSLGMSEIVGDELIAFMKRMYPMPFMKPRQLGMSSLVDPEGFIELNIKKIEKEVLARGGRYHVKPPFSP